MTEQERLAEEKKKKLIVDNEIKINDELKDLGGPGSGIAGHRTEKEKKGRDSKGVTVKSGSFVKEPGAPDDQAVKLVRKEGSNWIFTDKYDVEGSVDEAVLKREWIGVQTSRFIFRNNESSDSQDLTTIRHLMSKLMTKKTLEGKEYMVFPTVLIVEGVHNNLLYPEDELAKFPDSWNGRPVVVYHPNKNGKPVTANSPEVIEKSKVGFVYNAKWDKKKKKLMAEAWIDEEKCNEVDTDVMAMLNENKNLEVSTGLFTEDELVENGDWNTEKYNAVARNYRPDHLALLPKGTGACSWEDGAGLPRVNSQEEITDLGGPGSGVEGHKTDKEDGNTSASGTGKTPTAFDSVVTVSFPGKGGLPPKIVSGEMKSTNVKSLKPGDMVHTSSGSTSTVKTIQSMRPVRDPSSGRVSTGVTFKGVKGEEVFPPDTAVMKFNPIKRNEEEQMKSNVSIMTAIGMKVLELSHDQVRSQLSMCLNNEYKVSLPGQPSTYCWVREVYDDNVIYEYSGNGKTSVYQQSYSVSDNDQVSLVGDPIEVKQVVSYEPVVKSNVAGEIPAEQKQEDISTMEKKARVDALIKANIGFAESDREELMKTHDSILDKVEKTSQSVGESAKALETVKAEVVELKANVQKKPQTAEEYIAAAPAEMQEMLGSGLKLHKAQKTTLVEGLKANKRNKFSEAELTSKSTDELIKLNELAQTEVDYSGRGIQEPKVNESANKVPAMPTVNCGEQKKTEEKKA